MYHLELRQFPHNLCRFNLTAQQLHALIVEHWARDQWVEIEGRKWNPQQARLTILEGPRVPPQQLTMGRGWSNAQRQGEDVTERVLDAAKSPQSVGTQASPSGVAPDAGLLADSLGLELLTQLQPNPAPLSLAWRLARERCPEHSAGDCLTLAEQAVRSLLRSRLIVLVRRGGADDGAELEEGEADSSLRSIDSWMPQEDSGGIRMRRP